MNQSPEFKDSEELQDTLDVTDRFQNAMPAGTFSLPTYVRPSGSVGSVPQADILYHSMMGHKATAASATFATGLAAAGILYSQDTEAPSFSLWIESDHFVQGMSGCTVTQGVISVTNEGAVAFNFSGKGMQMVFAGTDAVQTQAASGATQIPVEDADRYSAGAYIQNYTKTDTNTGAGYKIASASGGTIHLESATATTWEVNDVVKGYLPAGTEIGEPIESKDTTVLLSSISTKIKNTEITLAVDKAYLTDEVGTEYPEDYIETKRDISSTLVVYFRKEDAKYFAEGYSGNNIPIRLTFGAVAGKQMVLHMQKCNIKVPEINFNAPAIELSMPMKALGTNGEDSAEIVFC